MSTDYGGKERAFLDGLKEETGRDLAGWMAAITEQKLTERNDIIHWLRRQGFMFAKASWLERIHHNGGKPIYPEGGGRPSRTPRQPRTERKEPLAGPPASEPEFAVQPAKVSPPLAPPTAAVVPADLDALLAKAKAYRPLAQHVIAQIRSVRPSARLIARETFLAIADPQEFARLGIGTRELRLHLALGDELYDEVVRKGASGGGLGKEDALTHMVVLTDARQVDPRLLDLVARAAARVNG